MLFKYGFEFDKHYMELHAACRNLQREMLSLSNHIDALKNREFGITRYSNYLELQRQIRHKEITIAFMVDDIKELNKKVLALEILYGTTTKRS